MSRQTYRSIGREIQALRGQSAKTPEPVTEQSLLRKANNLLHKPALVKVIKHKRDGIVNPTKMVDFIRKQYSVPPSQLSDMLSITHSSKVEPASQSQQVSYCYEVDFNWLEYCDDERFKKILKDDLANIEDMEQYVENNELYLCHVFAQCPCAKCTCNKCQCPYKRVDLTYNMGMITQNQFDYPAKQPMNDVPIITQQHYDHLLESSGYVRANTTSRDFHRWPTECKVRRRSVPANHSGGQFFGKTANNLSYADWKSYDVQIMKAPVHRSTFGGHLANRTMYKSSYEGNMQTNQYTAEQVKEKQLHQTTQKIYNEPMQTVYKQAYIPQRYAYNRLPFKYKSEQEKYEPIAAYPGQYVSKNQIEYPIRQVVAVQIVQKPWKQKLIKKLQNIK